MRLAFELLFQSARVGYLFATRLPRVANKIPFNSVLENKRFLQFAIHCYISTLIRIIWQYIKTEPVTGAPGMGAG